MTNQIVLINDLYKDYGDNDNKTKVLDGINLEINKGEFVSIMGPSGCGKSTLLYIIGGIEKPTSGNILTCGQNLFKLKDSELSKLRREKIGFVFQFYNLVQNLTVEENILLPAILAKKNDIECKDRLDSLLEMLGLTDKRNVIPSKLSGGQQQRVAIARAIINKPDLILADEPTGNLDSKSGTEIMNYFKEINQKFGITILMVTHSGECNDFATRKIFMKDGKIY